MQFRSTDGGENWMELGGDTNVLILNSFPAAGSDERTFYKAGVVGIHRTTDGGESWHLLMDGIVGTSINDLISFNDRLYTHTGNEIFQSLNGSRSWKRVRVNTEEVTSQPLEQKLPRIGLSHGSRLLISGNTLYFVSPIGNDLQICRLSADGNLLMPIQGVPTFDGKAKTTQTGRDSQETTETYLSETILDPLERIMKTKTLTATREVFYLEYNRSLFKWRLGDTEWTNTGLIDTSKAVDEDFHMGFKIAVSGETIYVGKRDGKLFRSLDGGSNWRDITSNLPLDFAHFKEIVFFGSTLYVATDKGVLVSETGEYWRVMTNRADARVVINQFALDGTEVYGIADTGVYRLDTRGQWEQFSTEVPDGIEALTIMNGRLYSAVKERGIFNISLENAELRANAQR